MLPALPLAENQVSNNNYTYAWYTTNMFRHVLQEMIRYDELMYRIFVLTQNNLQNKIKKTKLLSGNFYRSQQCTTLNNNYCIKMFTAVKFRLKIRTSHETPCLLKPFKK